MLRVVIPFMIIDPFFSCFLLVLQDKKNERLTTTDVNKKTQPPSPPPAAENKISDPEYEHHFTTVLLKTSSHLQKSLSVELPKVMEKMLQISDTYTSQMCMGDIVIGLAIGLCKVNHLVDEPTEWTYDGARAVLETLCYWDALEEFIDALDYIASHRMIAKNRISLLLNAYGALRTASKHITEIKQKVHVLVEKYSIHDGSHVRVKDGLVPEFEDFLKNLS